MTNEPSLLILYRGSRLNHNVLHWLQIYLMRASTGPFEPLL